MATTDYNVPLDKKIINHIKPYLPSEFEFLKIMLNAGVFQRDRLVEIALSKESNGLYQMDSKDHCDFDDDSDAKSNTVNYRQSQGPQGTLKIAGVKGKKYLRALIYDPKRDTFRYVAVWKWPSSLIDIEVSADPNTNSKYLNGKNGIELKSFKELAQFKF
tara:strand:+ start:136 stop:615 length:480 start_codon:yes stop_codon:yes gene_type:complete